MKSILVISLLAVALLAIGFAGLRSYFSVATDANNVSLNVPGTAAVDKDPKHREAPDVSFKELNGGTVELRSLRGKVVILDFWATWCQPCVREIPGFIALNNEYKEKGLQIVGAAVDSGELAEIKEFAEKHGMNYTVVTADEEAIDKFGDIEAIPTTYIIDRQGRIRHKHVGFTDKATFEKEIVPLLGETQ